MVHNNMDNTNTNDNILDQQYKMRTIIVDKKTKQSRIWVLIIGGIIISAIVYSKIIGLW